jgi:hypothetical protein
LCDVALHSKRKRHARELQNDTARDRNPKK